MADQDTDDRSSTADTVDTRFPIRVDLVRETDLLYMEIELKNREPGISASELDRLSDLEGEAKRLTELLRCDDELSLNDLQLFDERVGALAEAVGVPRHRENSSPLGDDPSETRGEQRDPNWAVQVEQDIAESDAATAVSGTEGETSTAPSLAGADLSLAAYIDPNQRRDRDPSPSGDERSEVGDDEQSVADGVGDEQSEGGSEPVTPGPQPGPVTRSPPVDTELIAIERTNWGEEQMPQVIEAKDLVGPAKGKFRKTGKVAKRIVPRFPNMTLGEATEAELYLSKKSEPRVCPCGRLLRGTSEFIKHFGPCMMGVRYVCPVFGCAKLSGRIDDTMSHIKSQHVPVFSEAANVTRTEIARGSVLPGDETCTQVPPGWPVSRIAFHVYHRILRDCVRRDGERATPTEDKDCTAMLGDWAKYFVQGPQEGVPEGELPAGAVGPLSPFVAAQWDFPPEYDTSGDEGASGGAASRKDRLKSSHLHAAAVGSPTIDRVAAGFLSLDMDPFVRVDRMEVEAYVDPDASTDDQSEQAVPDPRASVPPGMNIAIVKVAAPVGQPPTTVGGHPVTSKPAGGAARYANRHPGNLRAQRKYSPGPSSETAVGAGYDQRGRKIVAINVLTADDQAKFDESIHPRGHTTQITGSDLARDLVASPGPTDPALAQILQQLVGGMKDIRADNAQLRQRVEQYEKGETTRPSLRDSPRRTGVPPLRQGSDHQTSPLEKSDYSSPADARARRGAAKPAAARQQPAKASRSRSQSRDPLEEALAERFIPDDSLSYEENQRAYEAYQARYGETLARKHQSLNAKSKDRIGVTLDQLIAQRNYGSQSDDPDGGWQTPYPPAPSRGANAGGKRDRSGDSGGQAPKRQNQRDGNPSRPPSQAPIGRGRGRGARKDDRGPGGPGARGGPSYAGAAASRGDDSDDSAIARKEAELNELRAQRQRKQG